MHCQAAGHPTRPVELPCRLLGHSSSRSNNGIVSENRRETSRRLVRSGFSRLCVVEWLLMFMQSSICFGGLFLWDEEITEASLVPMDIPRRSPAATPVQLAVAGIMQGLWRDATSFSGPQINGHWLLGVSAGFICLPKSWLFACGNCDCRGALPTHAGLGNRNRRLPSHRLPRRRPAPPFPPYRVWILTLDRFTHLACLAQRCTLLSHSPNKPNI